MSVHRIARPLVRALPGVALLGVAALTLTASPALAGKRFSGFDTSFNLGVSSQSGAVCKADRDFDDPLVGDHVRGWKITCRGWSIPLGRIWFFESGSEAPQAWRTELAQRASCPSGATPASGLPGGEVSQCETVPTKLAYVVLQARAHGGLVVAEGMGPLSDVLTTATRYVAGEIDEPAAVAAQLASVAQAAKGGGLATADDAAKSSLDSRREEAYKLDQAWKFDQAEQIFSDLAAAQDTPAGKIEALYNSALAVSNEGRFDAAQAYFAQADALVAQVGSDANMRGLALNYRAADARNQRHYEDAVKFAEQAIAERQAAGVVQQAVTSDGTVIRISDTGGSAGFSGTRLSPGQRNALRDVQALDFEATSLEALGRDDDARDALKRAVAILDESLVVEGSDRPLTLAFASPWLNTQVRTDVLRLDRDIGRAADSTPAATAAVAAFRQKFPDSLPLAGFLIELARSEAAAGQDDRALADYEDAFSIFRDQRGALGASADLIGTYFDILLKRIGDAPAQHPAEVGRFFTASQTLAAPASADAAKRQAARVMSGDNAAAGLARALDDVDRTLQAKLQQVRDLEAAGRYTGDAKTKVDADLSALRAQETALQQQLQAADPKYASELRNLVGLDELQKTLRPGEVYVKDFMLANRGYGLVITKDAARPYAIEMSRDQAQAMVDAVRKPIDRLASMQTPVLGRYDVAAAHDLFQHLFGPIQSDVMGAQLVIYEPDTTLIGAPIAAFVVDDASVDTMKANLQTAIANHTPLTYANINWLGLHVASSVALSPSAFVQTRAAAASLAKQPFYGFGDPVITGDPREFARVKASSLVAGSQDELCERERAALLIMPRLPQTADEVKVVAASFKSSDYSLGDDFTDSRVQSMSRGDLAKYKVLYFATHGVLPPPSSCLQPALVTSLGDGVGSDGLLDVNQIPALNIDADIVVLSACDTGRTQGSGDDAVGLITTFVEAGARNVVVSNWDADSVATEKLMTAMFSKTGVSQAEALTEAERALMASSDKYGHPFYWATFMVVGDGARPIPSPN